MLIRIEASGLTPGWHAVHFRDRASCAPSGNTATALPSGTAGPGTPPVHGLLNEQGGDPGDLPNIHAAADGTVKAEIFSSTVSLEAGTPRADLLDADGSALVIYAKPDDYKSQPLGGAGDQVACSVVR